MNLSALRRFTLQIGMAAFIGSMGGCGDSGDTSTGGSGESASGSTTSGSTTSGSTTSGSTASGTGGGSATTSGTGGEGTTSSGTGGEGTGGAGGGAQAAKFVGNITTSGKVESNFLKYWNQITPENEGKWGSVEPQRDAMNWGPLDAVHKFAVDNKIPFKGHTFVWGSQQPGWISGLPQNEQAEEVEEWIKAFCERYPDVALIDVVNEPPPHTTPPYMAALGGPGASGYDWIIKSFQLARKHCPNAILILNDYNVLRWDTDNFVKIVNAVKGSGFIDAVGAQSHGLETLAFNELQANLNKVLGTGLPLYITEYDINEADDESQKNIMMQQFPLFWDTPQIKGITLWGYIYGATWMPNTGLIKNGQPRPAMTWLMNFLGK